jgi:prolyl oligopeptidase PreP (S9A serine peptidase family)
VTARKDWTNNTAKADVVVDGEILIMNAPVTYLLTLEKELTDVRTFIEHLPILDTSEDWHSDTSSGLAKTKETRTHRTKKKAKAIVLHPATKEHPAQTQLVSEDVLVGYWHTVKHSGAISRQEKLQLLEKAETLVNAVKEAREAANDVEETNTPKIGRTVFGYLFGTEQV